MFPADGPCSELILDQPRTYVVGRDPGADCRVDDDGISRRHLSIDTRSEPWLLVDLGSKNGSRVDGRPLGREGIADGAWLSLAGIPARLDRLSHRQLTAAQDELSRRMHNTERLLKRIIPLEDQNEILRNTLEAFVSITECEHGALILATADGRRRIAVLSGWDRFGGNHDVVSRVLATRSPVLVSDCQRDGEPNATAARAIACLPLILAGEVRGALYAQSSGVGKFFDALDLQMMQALARQAIFALGLSRLRKAMNLVEDQLPANPGALETNAEMTGRIERLLPPLRP